MSIDRLAVPSFRAMLPCHALQSALEVSLDMRANRHLLFIFTPFFLLLAVACSRGNDQPLPTAIPAAIPLVGSPGTNAINTPWQQVDNSFAGLSIQYPQDWNSSLIETNGILLTPILGDDFVNNEFTLVANIANFSAEQFSADIDSNDVTAVLNAIITNPTLGPADVIVQVQPPTALSIEGFNGAAARVRIDDSELDVPEDELSSGIIEDLGARNAVSMYVAVINQGDRTAVFTATTSVDSAETYQPIFDSMLKTVTFFSPPTE
ncbi:MAG: hypothetical protein GY943_06080 [Chloroflexi bacterium]|nr:hypothetical protein [Chloroflexota bacterium]